MDTDADARRLENESWKIDQYETTDYKREGNHGPVLEARPDVREGAPGVLRWAAPALQYAVDNGSHLGEEGLPGP